MSDPERRYLVYVGLGLGREPRTEMNDGTGRGVKWNTHDRKVRDLPADLAADILRQHPQDFVEAITPEQAAIKWSIPSDTLAGLAAKGAVHGETYYPKDGEPMPVIVLDSDTDDGIAKQRKAAKKAADKEK